MPHLIFTLHSLQVQDRLKNQPEDLVKAVAHAKASALLASHAAIWPAHALLITSDQVVMHNGIIREKPSCAEEARAFIKSYSSSSCQTVGCIMVTRVSDGLQHFSIESTNILYREIPDAVVDAVVDEGEVMSCAGGLMVENPLTRPFLVQIEGGEDQVQGLGKESLARLLNLFCQSDLA